LTTISELRGRPVLIESKVKTKWDGTGFGGTKIALLCGDHAVVYLRDDKPGIPFPGMWDLPGGGREGNEGPIECGIREVSEEFGLTLNAADVVHVERCQSAKNGLDNYFCAIEITNTDIGNIRFGDEGQRWEMMPISDFVNHEAAVPHLRNRLRALLEADEAIGL
jgi:8-oxo-dGTP diphosphatase